MLRRAAWAATAFGVVALALIAAGPRVIHWLGAPRIQGGSASDEFSPADRPARVSVRERRRTPWPTFGFDVNRSKVGVGFAHRPPYRQVWKAAAHDSLEFPPSVGYGKVFLAQQKGLFFALNARTGKAVWRKSFGRCSASSPTLARGVVYQSWMGDVPCKQARKGADGFLVAWRQSDGKELWRFTTRPIESSPLYHGGLVYVGSWDHRLYALDAMTGHVRWRFEGDDQLNSTPAYYRGRIYVGSNSGSLYAIDAHTGALVWHARSDSRVGIREEFYAGPAVAYGRVYIGNVDGTFTAYGAESGRVLWRRPLGSYIYASAAVWRDRVFIGTYDGEMFSLDAASGGVLWKRDVPSAVHSAAVVIDGLVYYASCSSCGSQASRKVKNGHDGTYAVNAITGDEVWRFRAGKYASPVVADSERIYLVGATKVFGMEPVERERRP